MTTYKIDMDLLKWKAKKSGTQIEISRKLGHGKRWLADRVQNPERMRVGALLELCELIEIDPRILIMEKKGGDENQ